MELTACQLDEIRAKQREDEAVRRMSDTSGRLLDKLTRPIDAHTARLAKAEVNVELNQGKYTAGTSIRA